MSDSILVALIAGSFNIAAIVVGRLLSRKEHQQTARTVGQIKEIVLNGKLK